LFADHLGQSNDELDERKLAELYEQTGPRDGGTRFFATQVRAVGRERRLAMVERPSPVSPTRQCQLLSLNRGALYYQPVEVSADELELMALIDRQYLRTPFYGSRRMTAWLQTLGHLVNRKRVQRLMRLMGIEAIYQRPRTSRPAPQPRTYPYLLRGLVMERVNQVWAPISPTFQWPVAFCTWSR